MTASVIFDLDDTLYDEIDYCRSGFAAVADFLASVREVKVPAAEVAETFQREFDSGNRTQTFNAALRGLGIALDPPLISSLVRVYRAHAPKIRLPKDSRDGLAALQRTHSLALLTDGYLPAQRLKVRALGISRFFRCILYTEQLGRPYWKPSPVGFVRVLEALHVQPDQAAYVADNPLKDFIAPNRLGMRSVQVARPLRLHRAPPPDPSAAARHTVGSIADLPALLRDLG
ncbi:MAG: HAD family hydrolase [Phycisphaerae bacterium]|nr:HAD family hydrolase [Phycisphaerae bacterium]